MSTRRVKIVNMVNKTVGVRLPEYGVNKKWSMKGQPQMIDYDIVEQLLWHEGFRRMIDRGILYIEDMKDKIDLGLEPEGAEEPENIIVLKDNQIKELLTTTPFIVFKKEIEKLTQTQVREIVNYAIANELVDVNKVSYLKDLTGLDIMKSISINHDIKKAEEEEAKSAQR